MPKAPRRVFFMMASDFVGKVVPSVKSVMLVMLLATTAVLLWWGRDELPGCAGCARGGTWREFQRKLAFEVHESGKAYDAVFIGDSITEAYRGTSMGSRECTAYRCSGVPEVFRNEFAGMKKIVLAISGDQTLHVLWRLDHGEREILPKTKSVVLLIGTNDLSQFISPHVGGWWNPPMDAAIPLTLAKEGAELVAGRVKQVAATIKQSMKADGKLVVIGLLPRGPTFKPPSFAWPNAIYTEAVKLINTELEKEYEGEESVKFVDCGKGFVNEEGLIIEGLMKDALHPTAKGSKHLAGCTKRALKELGITPTTNL